MRSLAISAQVLFAALYGVHPGYVRHFSCGITVQSGAQLCDANYEATPFFT
ncbi:hypothetical protein LPB67_08125 [Undibacterium sp. Jales W-56]|uniref:hypothetical protein n=1 Tax=Undibacterium sp. Jales W-56 TaxID=2897325 RepID=UPI0021D3B4B8|nr:hypothetical protein [Undibacterium sp. Jales W-56]MCU6433743.1 hypothetical protein [Undibacterium sp. Jales W-56]